MLTHFSQQYPKQPPAYPIENDHIPVVGFAFYGLLLPITTEALQSLPKLSDMFRRCLTKTKFSEYVTSEPVYESSPKSLTKKFPKVSKMRFGDYRYPHVDKAVDICDIAKFTRELEEMVEAMKGAVAVQIMMSRPRECAVSLYCRNEATRKARLKLSAITMSSEQSRIRSTGDSVWLGFERYAALFEHGTRRGFAFFSHNTTNDTSVRKLGLSIARNASSVECLLIGFGSKYRAYGSFKQFFSLDIWKEAFPSLQGAYLILNTLFMIDVSPHLMKHVRGVVHNGDERINQRYLNWMSSMIRNENNLIEEINFLPTLLYQAGLLDETLRSVRSFEVDLERMIPRWYFLVMSLERTKAEGDKLERLSVSGYGDFSNATAFERITRSRPNLQVLTLARIPSRDFVGVCQAVASSTLIAFQCTFYLSLWSVDAAVAVGQLLQHSTIRDLQLKIISSSGRDDCYNDFVRGVAEGLRATRLRRFHLTMSWSRQGVSIASMTKLYESVRENRSLMDIQLEGYFWDPWREPRGHDLPHAPPCPFSFFEFLSSRNQYLSQLLMTYESTLPAGLWPLILESASSDASILYSLLSFEPHIVKGKVEGTVAADREWGVDGPARKCTRIA